MKIGIDIDNVLSMLSNTLLAWHNRVYNTNFKEEDHNTFDLWEIWKCTKEEALSRIVNFFDSPEFKSTKPVLGAINAVQNLTEDHELHVITSRIDKVKDETTFWLNKHFSNSFHKIHFTGEMLGKNAIKKTKGDICKELGITLMIEDALHYAQEIAGKGVKVLLFDWPWNQTDTLPSNIVRVKSWKEIVEYINNI